LQAAPLTSGLGRSQQEGSTESLQKFLFEDPQEIRKKTKRTFNGGGGGGGGGGAKQLMKTGKGVVDRKIFAHLTLQKTANGFKGNKGQKKRTILASASAH